MSGKGPDLLVTFLGRVPKGEGGYRRTVYRFPDGERTAEVAFFGWALQERVRAARLLVLGTSGSMWDHLFEGDIQHGERGEAQRLALIEAVEARDVPQALLDGMEPLLKEALGIPVRLRIIPYCRTEAEQAELLRVLAEEVPEGAALHLDVSHGFRHLPMLALVAALYLQKARQARVEAIWYGAYDPDTGDAPVYDLNGLLRMVDWLQALQHFDESGDYGVLVPRLRRAGLPGELCDALERASFLENILNVGAATGELRPVLRVLPEARPDVPEAGLLLPLVRQRLEWVAEPRQFEKQIALARRALAHRDYLRATLYAFESVITRLCLHAGADVNRHEARERARKRYEEALHAGADAQEREGYLLLKRLRNQVAHGTRGTRGEVQRTLADEALMRQTLERLIHAIETGALPSAALAARETDSQ